MVCYHSYELEQKRSKGIFRADLYRSIYTMIEMAIGLYLERVGYLNVHRAFIMTV